MAKYYFAGMVPEENGQYSVYFPNFPGICTCGRDLLEAIEMAEDALKMMVEDYAERGNPLPEAYALADVKATVAGIRKLDKLPYSTKNTVYQVFETPRVDNSPVRVNVSIGKLDLEDIDRHAAEMGLTRSGFLVQAAKEYANT